MEIYLSKYSQIYLHDNDLYLLVQTKSRIAIIIQHLTDAETKLTDIGINLTRMQNQVQTFSKLTLAEKL